MNEPPDFPREQWKERLLDPQQGEWLERALSCLPPASLVQVFKGQFKKGDKTALLLVGRLSKFAAEDILENLGKIRERKPEVLERLVDFWLDRVGDYLDLDGMTQGTPTLLRVTAWLWSSSSEPPAVPWQLIATLAHRCETLTYERDEEQKRASDAIREANKATKQRSRQADKEERERAAQRTLKEQLETQTKTFTDQQKKIEKLKEDLQNAGQQVTTLKSTVRECDATLAEQSAIHKQQQEALVLTTKSLQDRRNGLQSELTQAQAALISTKVSLGQLEQTNRELSSELEELQKRAKVISVPTDVQDLQNTLIIDYELLGDTPSVRLHGLITMYEAVLSGETSALLDTNTNWLDLDHDAFDGILMLGLEPLLLDLANLPVRRYLDLQSFKHETILRFLTAQLDSPRLEVTAGG